MTNREKMIGYIIQEAESNTDGCLKKMFLICSKCYNCPFNNECENPIEKCSDFIGMVEDFIGMVKKEEEHDAKNN